MGIRGVFRLIITGHTFMGEYTCFLGKMLLHPIYETVRRGDQLKARGRVQ
jgi:hypothetical protein